MISKATYRDVTEFHVPLIFKNSQPQVNNRTPQTNIKKMYANRLTSLNIPGSGLSLSTKNRRAFGL
jgi:hypothetical protein